LQNKNVFSFPATADFHKTLELLTDSFSHFLRSCLSRFVHRYHGTQLEKAVSFLPILSPDFGAIIMRDLLTYFVLVLSPNPAGTSYGGRDEKKKELRRGSVKEDGGSQLEAEHGAEATSRKAKTGAKAGPSNSRRKAFITLTYIVLAYVVCWVPFHFVFDVSLASPASVSGDLYTAAFWLAYINSGLNPFMYAFSSAEFRGAVLRLLRCRF